MLVVLVAGNTPVDRWYDRARGGGGAERERERERALLGNNRGAGDREGHRQTDRQHECRSLLPYINTVGSFHLVYALQEL